MLIISERAVAAGEAAVALHWSYSFCHKYMALSQKAMGGMKPGKLTMARALVCEALWDDQHLKQL